MKLLSVQLFHCYLNAELGAVGEIILNCLCFIMFLILAQYDESDHWNSCEFDVG